jgi:hypothetical protein
LKSRSRRGLACKFWFILGVKSPPAGFIAADAGSEFLLPSHSAPSSVLCSKAAGLNKIVQQGERTYLSEQVSKWTNTIVVKYRQSLSFLTMKVLASLLLAALGHRQLVVADWQFRSRPDLAPPRLNITIPAADTVEKGYLFVAPFEGYRDVWRHGPLQPGPYIFRDNGDLVWSGFSIFSIWAANFQAARWKGKDILFSFEGSHNPGYGHGHGHVTILDQHYETIRELRAGNSKFSDKHEFHIINEETAVLQVYQPLPRDLSEFGGSTQQQWIVNAIFQGTLIIKPCFVPF